MVVLHKNVIQPVKKLIFDTVFLFKGTVSRDFNPQYFFHNSFEPLIDTIKNICQLFIQKFKILKIEPNEVTASGIRISIVLYNAKRKLDLERDGWLLLAAGQPHKLLGGYAAAVRAVVFPHQGR